MRNKKAQGLPSREMIRAILAILAVLVVAAAIGSGAIKTGFNNLLNAIGLAGDEDAAAGDYIIQASAEIIDENTVVVHFTPNPIRCAEIRESKPYVITQGFTDYPEKYIPKYEEADTIQDKGGNCGKQRDSEDISLISPEKFGTRILNIEVYGNEQGGFPLETVPVEVNEWERLLRVYLNSPMEGIGDHTLSGPYGAPILWSLVMHNKDMVGLVHCEQSMNLNQESIDEVEDLLGLDGSSIEDVPEFTQGNFKEFLTKLGCAHPEKELGDRTLQIIMTAMFGDIQDFERQSGEPDHPGQPVPRIRDGTGIRGYYILSWSNQLLPIYIDVNYPGDDSPFTFSGSVRDYAHSISACVGLVGGRPSWKGEQGASIPIDTSADSCFGGKPIEVLLYFCPEDKCKVGENGGETPAEEPEVPEEPDEPELTCTSPNCAEEIDDCNIDLPAYDDPGCCAEAGPLPAVKPADSYYVHQGFCYHCTADRIWGDKVDDSLCMP